MYLIYIIMNNIMNNIMKNFKIEISSEKVFTTLVW